METLFARFLENPNSHNLGVLLGFCDTKEEQTLADQRALVFFKYVGVISSKDSVVHCPFVINLGEENQRPCGAVMDTENDSSRASGFRFVCCGTEVPHPKTKVSPRDGTLLEQANLGYAKILR